MKRREFKKKRVSKVKRKRRKGQGTEGERRERFL